MILKRIKIITVLCFILFIGMACASFGTHEGRYLTALRFFNDTVESYLVCYRQAPDEIKAKWHKDIDPTIVQASAMLDLWGLTVVQGNSTIEKEKAYFAIRDKLLALLIRYGVEIKQQ
jgi:hypothetical protein